MKPPSSPAHETGASARARARPGLAGPKEDAQQQQQQPPPLRIAILLNSYKSRLLPAIRASYERTIGAVAPPGTTRLTFYEPANNRGDFPDPACFDLIVFGGSNVDPRKSHPWILDVHDFLRRVRRDHPRKKILGICWGHQTVARVFGGVVVDAKYPELGVATVSLTDKGRQFFPAAAAQGSFRLQQHHRREVASPAPGFEPLARSNQCLLSADGAVLTFQGHPEKDAETARLRIHDALRWFGTDAVDEKAWARFEELIHMEHDGSMVWRQVLGWVREESTMMEDGGDAADKSSRI